MAEEEVDDLRLRLEAYIGKPMGPPAVAPDAVNLPMVRPTSPLRRPRYTECGVRNKPTHRARPEDGFEALYAMTWIEPISCFRPRRAHRRL